jgi:hypothetical protein
MAFTEHTYITEKSKISGCSTKGYHSKFSVKEKYLRSDNSNTGKRPNITSGRKTCKAGDDFCIQQELI